MSNFLSKMFASNGSVVVVINTNNGVKSYNVNPDDRNYVMLKAYVVAEDADNFVESMERRETPVKEVMKQFAEGVTHEGVMIDEDGSVLLNGEPFHNTICYCIKKMWEEDLDVQPMMKFLENLLENPSRRAVTQLYSFLEQCGLSITEDGCFLAYKSVMENYKDKHSGTYDNSPGAINEMPRRDVDDNCTIGCSYGFHVGALAYAGPGGYFNNKCDKVVICKVDPKDVVSVPLDCSCQKVRVCRYEVVADFTQALGAPVYSGAVNNEDYVDEDDDDYEEILQPNDLLEGWDYTCIYTNQKGERKQRYFIVDSNKAEDKYITVELIDPEKNAGQYRNFRKEDMEDIREV